MSPQINCTDFDHNQIPVNLQLHRMKQIFILLCILGSLQTAFAQKATAPVITRYYVFTGTIDKYPVTLHLYRINDKFSGSYYYNSTGEAIEISGDMDKNRFLKLTHEYYDQESNVTEILSGNFRDSTFSGTWSYKGKLLPFRVSQQKDNSGLTFDYIYTSGSKKLPKGEEYNRTEIGYDAATIWPTPASTQTATRLVKQIIYEAFGEKDGQGEIGKIMLKEKNATLNTSPQKEDESIDYYIGRKIKVAYQNEKLLTISNFLYVDGGGAHGNYGISYTCVDLVNNRKLDITDVLDTLACRETLRTLLVKKFRAAYHVKNEEKTSEYLFHDDIPVSGNFSLTAKGIGFHYDPYEIGPYALGAVSIYISFKELNGYLKLEFKKLNGISGQ